MNEKLDNLGPPPRGEGRDAAREERSLQELPAPAGHPPLPVASGPALDPFAKSLYAYQDQALLLSSDGLQASYAARIRSLDELLERDKMRQEDGFPRKVRVGRMIRPGQGGKDKVVVVPTTVEEKFYHDAKPKNQEEEESSGGSGEGEEGEVIGEQPVREEEGQGGSGPGQGEEGGHEVESNAYDLGRILTEKFHLPNLKDKGKKRSLSRYTYDLTDRNRGFGQVLDKKATLRQLLKTNIALGRVATTAAIDPTEFIVTPKDRVYRILSREKDYESQAMVFFLRDYSGSMSGKPTEVVVSQHVMIYSWLLYQYDQQVETRFILHDTEAKEVPDFYSYYNSRVAGGTQVAAAFRLVNELVARDNLSRDYNIYIFHGTDGDDWDRDGGEMLPALRQMLTYANRVGITIAEAAYGGGRSEVEQYLTRSGLLTERAELLRLDVLSADADENRVIEGIKNLIG